MGRCHNVLFTSGMEMRLWQGFNLELNSKRMSLLRTKIKQGVKNRVSLKKFGPHWKLFTCS